MNFKRVFLLSITTLICSTAAYSQQGLTEPQMSVQNFKDVELRNMADGREVYRISAATVGLVYVKWPKGAVTTPHNHANELVLTVISGRLKAMSGDQEFIMEAGDVVTVPAWVEHSYEALEDSLTMEAAGPG